MSEPAKEEINAMGLIDEIILTVKRGLLPADPGWRSTIQTLYDHAQVAGVDPREDIVIVYGDHVEGRPIWFKANRKLIGTLHRDTGIMTFGDEIKHWEKPTVTEEQQEYESGPEMLRIEKSGSSVKLLFPGGQVVKFEGELLFVKSTKCVVERRDDAFVISYSKGGSVALGNVGPFSLGPEEHMHDERGRPPIIDP